MDVEATHAMERLGSRLDRLERSLTGRIDRLESSLGGRIDGVLEDVALNWIRTQALFETLRDDIKMLAGAAADLATREPPSGR